MVGQPQQDSSFQGTIQKDQAPQGPYIEHHTARHEQRKDRSYQQQDQADHQEGIWLSQHPEHAGYGLSSLL